MATLHFFIISLLSPVIHSKFFLAAPLYYTTTVHGALIANLLFACSIYKYMSLTLLWIDLLVHDYCFMKRPQSKKKFQLWDDSTAIPWLAKNMRSRFRTSVPGFCFEPLNFRVILREINWLPLSSFWTFSVFPTCVRWNWVSEFQNCLISGPFF